jgi:hypothetical protein
VALAYPYPKRPSEYLREAFRFPGISFLNDTLAGWAATRTTALAEVVFGEVGPGGL